MYIKFKLAFRNCSGNSLIACSADCMYNVLGIVFYKLDVHGSVHHNINLIEINNKMRPCSRIYYSNVS